MKDAGRKINSPPRNFRGGMLGVKMALSDLEKAEHPSTVCHIVGDGSFLCGSPSSALWVASKYEILTLTIVLNNEGE